MYYILGLAAVALVLFYMSLAVVSKDFDTDPDNL